MNFIKPAEWPLPVPFSNEEKPKICRKQRVINSGRASAILQEHCPSDGHTENQQ
jgi:hypothetical protein